MKLLSDCHSLSSPISLFPFLTFSCCSIVLCSSLTCSSINLRWRICSFLALFSASMVCWEASNCRWWFFLSERNHRMIQRYQKMIIMICNVSVQLVKGIAIAWYALQSIATEEQKESTYTWVPLSLPPFHSFYAPSPASAESSPVECAVHGLLQPLTDPQLPI